MFLAHLPAGYLSALAARRSGLRRRGAMAACLVGSLFPDIDLIYCYLVDGGRVHHHLYATHFPALWLALLLLSLAACAVARWRAWAVAAALFCASCLLHLVLDMLVGDVPLLAPWDMRFFAFATVEARYSPWWLNFVLHWSMLVELALIAAALVAWRCRRNPS